MLKIASCDELGSTYIDDKNVYRIVVPSQKQRVLEMSKLIQELTSGNIIDTEVVSSSECPSQINADKSSLLLKHRKIKFISYPHEWCAAMLKDAALYHLELSISLLN